MRTGITRFQGSAQGCRAAPPVRRASDRRAAGGLPSVARDGEDGHVVVRVERGGTRASSLLPPRRSTPGRRCRSTTCAYVTTRPEAHGCGNRLPRCRARRRVTGDPRRQTARRTEHQSNDDAYGHWGRRPPPAPTSPRNRSIRSTAPHDGRQRQRLGERGDDTRLLRKPQRLGSGRGGRPARRRTPGTIARPVRSAGAAAARKIEPTRRRPGRVRPPDEANDVKDTSHLYDVPADRRAAERDQRDVYRLASPTISDGKVAPRGAPTNRARTNEDRPRVEPAPRNPLTRSSAMTPAAIQISAMFTLGVCPPPRPPGPRVGRAAAVQRRSGA